VDRLFLDANVLFSAAYREDAPLRALWRLPGVERLTSAYALAEVGRHLDGAQRARLARLVEGVRVVPDAPSHDLPPAVLLRGKDIPILVTAIAAGATHLITGDRRDFGRFFGRRVSGVLILPPRDYLGKC
jgi:predicted nucleic acid-binding protein